ncbi:phospholipase A2 inhibitor subunit gamma B-like [Xenopus laevis]|uniref:Phospholipase A2 inhibitor subunit gamma B-like n=1 Tax=Xenopus laevis TaxID=8355 RepID=A0A8J1LDR0_XENLA|nr:phospholipase A2 inhibitor subunit gamma B-like [Xenopus laevis]
MCLWRLGNLLTMRSAVGLLCVLSALVPTGDCISCVACIELASTSCRGKSMECPPGAVCGTSFLKASDMLKGVIRSCFQQSDCKKNGTFSVEDYKGKQTVSCCATNNCTPPKPTWNDSPDIKLNGLMCPSCVSFSNGCFGTDQVSCSGDENYCFTQSLRTSGPFSVTLSGCATESLCQMGNGSVNLDSKTNSTVHCTKANIGDAKTTELTVTSDLKTNSTEHGTRVNTGNAIKLAATVMATIKSGDAGSAGTSSSTSILHSSLASILFLCQSAILLSLSSINL